MADDWIKMRGELWTHPRFLSLYSHLVYTDDGQCPGFLRYVCGEDALGIGVYPPSNRNVTDRALQCVTEQALRDVTMSCLLRVWCAVNAHCKVSGNDAIMAPMSLCDLDDVAGCRDFGEAFEQVGWVVVIDPNTLLFPNFLEYNEPACLRKKKALTNAERQDRFRQKQTVTKSNESNGREEKIREEEIREEIQNTNSCSEAASQPSEPPVLVFPCVGKVTEWYLFPSKLAEYRETYPGIDVLAECRKALQWCRDNKKNQKTAQGMPKFLGGWLGRNQDRAPVQQKVVKAFVTPPADPRTPEQKAADLAADRKRVEADKAQAASAAELLAKLRGIGTMPEENP